MAKLIKDGVHIHIDDGKPIYEAADDLGVLFSCCHGVCGACRIEVISGEENLSPKSVSEEDYDLDPGYRLACQCKITGGEVEIDQ